MTWRHLSNPAQISFGPFLAPRLLHLILSLALSFLLLFDLQVLADPVSSLWKETLTLVRTMKGGKSKANTSKKPDSKLAVKKGAEKKPKGGAKGKGGKDPNKPKRPPSAFFVFMEQFRKDFKEKNPTNKQVSVVGKAGGDKWKSLSQSEKAPYVAKAEKLKLEYQKKMKAYDADEETKKDLVEESSDKSKSEVSDEDEGSEEDDDEEDDD